MKRKILKILILMLSLFILSSCKEKPEEVVIPDLEKISIDTSLAKLSYVVGEDYSKYGIKVIATYSDSSSKEVTNYQLDSDGFLKYEEGNYRIVITYTEKEITKTAVYEVEVKSILSTVNYLVGIDVVLRNDYFLKGSNFNKDNLKVYGVYSDSSKKDISDVVRVDSSRYKANEIGVYEIIVTYSETYGENEAAVTIESDSFYFARVVEKLPEE